MSIGQIKDYTPNFNLIIPRFDIATWHDYMESNFRSIDALFFNMFGINQYRGEWQNSTTYQVGDVLFIGDPDSQYTGRLVKVLVVHTTTANDSFDVYYAHNPINYDLFMDAAAAEQAAKLARDWAIKTNGKVQGLDYSAKYYANLITPISTEIVNVSNIANEIINVSNISTNVANVSAISTEIVTVSNKINEIITNSNNISQITINSNNINNINTNATNINAININANNISAIQNAYANAQSALNSKNKAQEWAISENIVDNSDYSAKYYANQSQTSAELSAQYANDKINQTHITNCITEIPQDIKLELNNGTLTLKAGSKVYVPNGAGVFDEVTISSDFSVTSTANSQEFILLAPSRTSITHFNKNFCSSGPTQPTVTTTYYMWYDTTNNKIKFTTDNGVSWIEGFSLPLGLSTSTSSGITSIEQVFNGFGYIGKINFITNVKLLVAKGYNTDGTYHNQEYIINSPIIARNYFENNSIMFLRYNNRNYQIYNIGKQNYLGELDYVPVVGSTFQWYYNTANRMWYMHEQGEQSWRQVDYANLGISTSTETNFKEVFRAVDYNDFSNLKNTVDINDSNAVHKTENETITGHKIFTNNIDRIVNAIRGQTPSSNSYSDIRFVDNNNNWLAGLEYSLLTDKSSWISLIISDSVGDTTNVKGLIQLGVNSDGNVYATAPTPNVSSNGTNIATTAYVNNKHQVVSVLPANPNANIFYYIPE